VPLSIVGLSYSVGAFPTLAGKFLKNQKREFLEYFSVALRHIVFWSLPATVLFIVLRAQIVRVILGVGAFSWVDTRLTAASLLILSLSILSQGLVMLLIRAFYAAGHTLLPLVINLVSSLATVSSAFLFLNIFRNSSGFKDWFLSVLKAGDLLGAEVLILPLAVSLGSLINIILLLIYFKRIFGSFDGQDLNRSFGASALSSVVLGASSYWSLKLFALIFNLDTFLGIFLQGFLSGVLGIIIGALVLYWLKNREFQEISSTISAKFWRKVPIVGPEPEKLP
jgi:putative peptidoglycan lipid II flippase